MALSDYQQLQKVREDYDRIGQHFAQTRRKKMWAEIIPFIKKVKSGMRVLDVGCGNGRLLSELKGKKIYYTGLDFSQSLIDQAKKQYPKRRFLKRDVTEIEDWRGLGQFDAGFCLGVLHHIPDRKRQHDLLQQIYLHTKPGGTLTISVWNLLNIRFFKLHIAQIFKKIQHGNLSYLWVPYKVSDGKKVINSVDRFCKTYFPTEILSLVKQVGFKIDTYYYARKGETKLSMFTGDNFVIHAHKSSIGQSKII